MPRAKYLMWMDFETNGGSPQVPIEVGALLTTVDAPFDVISSFESVIKPAEPLDLSVMPEVVVKMHTDNGLLADLAAGEGRPCDEVEDALIAMMAAVGHKHEFLIAGSGVLHFDRAQVVKPSMPRLDKWLRYPGLDIGVVRRAFDFAGRPDLQRSGLTYEGDPRANKPHRGMADILDHLAEWRDYAAMFAALPTG